MKHTTQEQRLLQFFGTKPDEWQPSEPGDLAAFYKLCDSGKVIFEEIVRVRDGVIYIRPRCASSNDEKLL
ncbi:hypothetical protein [Marinococcus halophilus]|uniref:hypothetical protein n=1 Tax=Marinococcus halophilus TaxID=1371 RepID=UPI0009A7F94C|nr:hypothetical protein [Marinococcus halophilus]